MVCGRQNPGVQLEGSAETFMRSAPSSVLGGLLWAVPHCLLHFCPSLVNLVSSLWGSTNKEGQTGRGMEEDGGSSLPGPDVSIGEETGSAMLSLGSMQWR